MTLFFVVSFGSSLDISAIQADLPMPIDYNAELQTVGADLASGRPCSSTGPLLSTRTAAVTQQAAMQLPHLDQQRRNEGPALPCGELRATMQGFPTSSADFVARV